MTVQQQLAASTLDINSRPGIVALISMTVLATILAIVSPAQAQTLTVLHSFAGMDGESPVAGFTVHGSTGFYGTAAFGGSFGGKCGSNGCGTVFQLTHRGANWTVLPIYSFQGGSDGANPRAGVIVGSDGSLYGTTALGGIGSCAGYGFTGCGTVFKLTPPAAVCETVLCPWTETTLYRFAGLNDGANPWAGSLVFDPAGNLYGTTMDAGPLGMGTVYELKQTNGNWTLKVIYSFTGGNNGGRPYSGVILDGAGNLYGTTAGNGLFGSLYKLTPSGSGWTETILHSFQDASAGFYPWGGLLLDASGNLYGTTFDGGSTDGGTVYELSPTSGGWTFTTLYGGFCLSGPELGGSAASLVMDAAGSLYGTTMTSSGSCTLQNGSVFKLTPSGDGWIYTSLHNFLDLTDGARPLGNVVLDANGNVYGTSSLDGVGGDGVAWEITP